MIWLMPGTELLRTVLYVLVTGFEDCILVLYYQNHELFVRQLPSERYDVCHVIGKLKESLSAMYRSTILPEYRCYAIYSRETRQIH